MMHIKTLLRHFWKNEKDLAYEASNHLKWCIFIFFFIQWHYSPTGPWPTEQLPPVSEASANFCG